MRLKRVIRATFSTLAAIALVAIAVPFFQWMTADGSGIAYLAAAGPALAVAGAVVLLFMYGFLSDLDQPEPFKPSKRQRKGSCHTDADPRSGAIHTVTGIAMTSDLAGPDGAEDHDVSVD